MDNKKLPFRGIRKQWFFLGLAYMLLSPLLLSHFVHFIGAIEPPVVSWTIFWMFINAFAFLIFYQCAGKKPGKKLLTLYLIISPVTALAVLLQLFGMPLAGNTISLFGFTFDYAETFNSHLVSYQMQDPWNIKLLLVAVSYFALFGLFYTLSFRLRKENNRLHSENQEVLLSK